jgi:hypothetical protein
MRRRARCECPGHVRLDSKPQAACRSSGDPMSLALILAASGAVAATIGSLIAIRNRMDAIRKRQARALALRTDLIPLREILAAAKAKPEQVGSLTGSSFKGHVRALGEGRPGCPDRQLRHLLPEVIIRCLNVSNLAPEGPDGPISYALTKAIDQALSVITRALDRLDHIERSAPG